MREGNALRQARSTESKNGAYFLGRTLGEKAIRLFGEEEGPGIRILPPAAFLAAADRYDLVVNVDSLTEMARDRAVSYVDQNALPVGKS